MSSSGYPLKDFSCTLLPECKLHENTPSSIPGRTTDTMLGSLQNEMNFPICRSSTSVPNLSVVGLRVGPRVACNLSHPYLGRDTTRESCLLTSQILLPHHTLGQECSSKEMDCCLNWACHKKKKSGKEQERTQSLARGPDRVFDLGPEPHSHPLEPTPMPPAQARAHPPAACTQLAPKPQSAILEPFGPELRLRRQGNYSHRSYDVIKARRRARAHTGRAGGRAQSLVQFCGS